MIKAFNNLEENLSAWSGSDSHGLGNRKDYSFMFDVSHNKTLELARETNKILDLGLLKYVNDYPSLENQKYYSTVVKAYSQYMILIYMINCIILSHSTVPV